MCLNPCFSNGGLFPLLPGICSGVLAGHRARGQRVHFPKTGGCGGRRGSISNFCTLACLYHKAKSAASCFSISSHFMCFHESLEGFGFGFFFKFLVKVMQEHSFKIKSYKKTFHKKPTLPYRMPSPRLATGR